MVTFLPIGHCNNFGEGLPSRDRKQSTYIQFPGYSSFRYQICFANGVSVSV